MIKGHGDDAYRYKGITISSDFSSNICPPADLGSLLRHLSERPALIAHYPEPEAWSLEQALADLHHVAPECVVVTNGATDAIYLVAQAFPTVRHTEQPTFSEYEDAFRLFPTTDRSRRALWRCNPNNPTGSVLADDEARQLAAGYDLAVFDQSYADYTEVGVLTPREAVALGNVVLIYSLTKTYGVPGLRIGYLVAAPPLADAVRRLLRPWAVSAVAIEAGRFLVARHETMRARPDMAEAQRLHRLLSQTDGLSVLPTSTNFMLCHLDDRQPHHTAARLKDYLAQRHGILIRDASNFRGLDAHHFRVASQTAAENDALARAIHTFLHD